MQVIKVFFVFTATNSFTFEQKHLVEHMDNIPRWKIVHWAAAQVKFDPYNRIDSAVERFRLELPFEHEHGRCLKYTVDEFEGALAKHCPNNQGNVHQWAAVFKHVPTKLLTYEEIFG